MPRIPVIRTYVCPFCKRGYPTHAQALACYNQKKPKVLFEVPRSMLIAVTYSPTSPDEWEVMGGSYTINKQVWLSKVEITKSHDVIYYVELGEEVLTVKQEVLQSAQIK